MVKIEKEKEESVQGSNRHIILTNLLPIASEKPCEFSIANFSKTIQGHRSFLVENEHRHVKRFCKTQKRLHEVDKAMKSLDHEINVDKVAMLQIIPTMNEMKLKIANKKQWIRDWVNQFCFIYVYFLR